MSDPSTDVAATPLSPKSASITLSPPSSPLDAAGQALHASYHEFKLRAAARAAEAAAEAAQAEAHTHRNDPVENEADKPDAILLEPVQPFYSSALSDARTGGGGVSSARRPSAASRINNPPNATVTAAPNTAPATSPPTTPIKRPASTPAKAPRTTTPAQMSGRLVRPTSSSEIRRQSISDRKAQFTQQSSSSVDIHADAFASVPRRNSRSGIVPPGSGSSSRASSTSRPVGTSGSNKKSSNINATPKSSNANAANQSNVTPSSIRTSRTVRKSLVPVFSSEKRSASSDTRAKVPSPFQQIKSAAKANKGTYETRFEVLEPKGPRTPVTPSKGDKDEFIPTTPNGRSEPGTPTSARTPSRSRSRSRSPVKSPRSASGKKKHVSILDGPLVRRDGASDDDADDAGKEAVPFDASLLNPRASQVVAVLSNTKSAPNSSASSSLIPQHLRLDQLPHSSSKKVPLSLMSRGGAARDCESCHSLHMKVDKLQLELARSQEHLNDAHAHRNTADMAIREKTRLMNEIDGLTNRLHKSESRCATMSNQLTTIRLDHEKHLRAELLAAQEQFQLERSTTLSKHDSLRSTELETAKGRVESLSLEKKGLIAKLAQLSTSKRALEKTLSSLEGSYKELQESYEASLVKQRRQNLEEQEKDACIANGKEDILTVQLQLSQAERKVDSLLREVDSLKRSLAESREESDSFRSAADASRSTESALHRSEELVSQLSSIRSDLEEELSQERFQLRQARMELDSKARLEQQLQELSEELENKNQVEQQLYEAQRVEDTNRNELVRIEHDLNQARESGECWRLEVEEVRKELRQVQIEKGAIIEENMLLQKQLQVLKRTGFAIGSTEMTGAAFGGVSGGPPDESQETTPPMPTPRRTNSGSTHTANATIPTPTTATTPRPASRLSTPRATSNATSQSTPSPRARQGSPLPTPHPMSSTPSSSGSGSGSGKYSLRFGSHSSLKSGSSAVGSISSRVKSPTPLQIERSNFNNTKAAGVDKATPLRSPRGEQAKRRADTQAELDVDALASSTHVTSPTSPRAQTPTTIAAGGNTNAPSVSYSSVSSSLDSDPVHKSMVDSLSTLKQSSSYNDSRVQQSMLILEGLMAQAAILANKWSDKSNALAETPQAATAQTARLQAELKVIQSTLDLTKENIRTHWHALLAMVNGSAGSASVAAGGASSPLSSSPLSASSASSAPASFPSFPIGSPIRSLMKPIFTQPAFATNINANTTPAAAALQATTNRINATAFTQSVLAQPQSNRFATWSATYAPTATTPTHTSTTAVTPTNQTLMFSPPSVSSQSRFASSPIGSISNPALSLSSVAGSPSSGPIASSSYFHHTGTGGSTNFHRTLALPTNQTSSAATPASLTPATPSTNAFTIPTTLTTPTTTVTPTNAPPQASTLFHQQQGGSTFNLQVSKDAKNIYITHSSVPAVGVAPLSSTATVTPSGFVRPQLSAPVSTPLPSSSAAGGLSRSVASFAASPDRLQLHSTSTPTILTSPTVTTPMSITSNTPFSARTYGGQLASPINHSAATMPTSTEHRF